ncbi:MAG TPA: hypothetical protein DF613_14370, partial [Lachnospiraceae bacterium]|nr:hypothetical protein [Lachnospiraceae bacterium]
GSPAEAGSKYGSPAEAGSKYGSPAAEHKLDEIAEKEKWVAQIAPLFENDEDSEKGSMIL